MKKIIRSVFHDILPFVDFRLTFALVTIALSHTCRAIMPKIIFKSLIFDWKIDIV